MFCNFWRFIVIFVMCGCGRWCQEDEDKELAEKKAKEGGEELERSMDEGEGKEGDEEEKDGEKAEDMVEKEKKKEGDDKEAGLRRAREQLLENAKKANRRRRVLAKKMVEAAKLDPAFGKEREKGDGTDGGMMNKMAGVVKEATGHPTLLQLFWEEEARVKKQEAAEQEEKEKGSTSPKSPQKEKENPGSPHFLSPITKGRLFSEKMMDAAKRTSIVVSGSLIGSKQRKSMMAQLAQEAVQHLHDKIDQHDAEDVKKARAMAELMAVRVILPINFNPTL
jgi:hypothetical protein